jgi:hypothetical protein
MHNDDFIPANPVINSRNINERTIINTTMSVRDRSTAPVVIPKWPPVPVQVEVPAPAKRRQFVAPVGYAQKRTRKED